MDNQEIFMSRGGGNDVAVLKGHCLAPELAIHLAVFMLCLPAEANKAGYHHAGDVYEDTY